jgi:hypothetical protein
VPFPRPLDAPEARRTLAHRLGRRVDRLRQFSTRFGLRPYRVTLVWTKWTGRERGQGREEEIPGGRIEVLPTPMVKNLDAGNLSLMAAGMLPVGSVRVSKISVNYTQDQLVGLAIPDEVFTERNEPPRAKSAGELPKKPSNVDLPQPFDFHWEVREDGRGDDPPPRWRFRLASWPERRPGDVEWRVTLERVSDDDDREGNPTDGFDPVP